MSLATRCAEAGLSAAAALARHQQADGSFGPDAADLAAIYKAPSAFLLGGRPRAAQAATDHLVRAHLRPDGDLHTAPGLITADPVLSQYRGYLTGWVAMGAQRLGRYDLSLPAWGYFRRSHHQTLGGSTCDGPARTNSGQELFMSAHLGMCALTFCDIAVAEGAGLALERFLDAQPDPDRLLLRMDVDGALVTDFPKDAAALYQVDRTQPGQCWFFAGYPIAFLTRLYQAIHAEAVLEAAERYVRFVLPAGDLLAGEHFAHKVGWGLGLYARVTGDQAALALSARVAESLVAAQHDDGLWLPDAPLVTRLDQSAEVACWLLELSAIL